jgi:hypothetical protein
MTTPPDDIAKLSERLRRTADPFWHHTRDEVIAEAATALDALSARVKELEAHNRRLGQGGAERYWENRYRDEATATARAEQQRDEAYERAAKMAEQFGEPYALNANTGAMMFRAVTEKLAAAIRRLAAGTEREGK